MSDAFYYEGRGLGTPGLPKAQWPKVKMIDNGDGTYSIATQAIPNSSRNITGAGTTLVKAGAGVLSRIVVNKPVSLSVVTVYDSLTAAGTKIATLTNPLALLQQQVALDFNVAFATGLTVVTSAADDITVVYR